MSGAGWRRPPAPTPEALAAATPAIQPVEPGTPRPRWSVMIPTHNCADLLRRTLASVLAQAPGPEAMQIEVIDDGSTRDDPGAVVREIGEGRVRFSPNPRNLGPTETFNVCLRQARGEWVHLLHGDDLVLPGFYAECDRAAEQVPGLAMVMGQVVVVDEHDRWTGVWGPRPEHAGRVFPDFLHELVAEQIAQFAGVAVRRAAYERVGGFCTLFGHVADLDMWFRVGETGPVWCTSRPYGLFRVHSSSDTRQQMVRGTNILEEYLALQVNLRRLAAKGGAPDTRAHERLLARRAYRYARKLGRAGSTEGRLNQARWAFRLDPGPKTAGLFARAWLGHRLAGSAAP